MQGAEPAAFGGSPPRLRLDGNDFTAIVMTASAAQMVRPLQFAAIGAFLKRLSSKRMMAAPHIPPGRRSFSLGDGHVATCSILLKRITTSFAASHRRHLNAAEPAAGLVASG